MIIRAWVSSIIGNIEKLVCAVHFHCLLTSIIFIFTFKIESNRYFCDSVEVKDIMLLIFKCVNQYLLSLSHRLKS